ncbi:hypothetical protein GJV26_03310 [Massilia dura]|uniref:Uncharacterized protein n=1 Tax=Pseudoduganella dura TaxID=321982 RepID=A0A6I3XD95_9BURK|nr:hypothetical protein [Pseudoduganella dura]MUI11521.1 hypothetical protein [Pseudoduganella dura]GGX97154.1 hypothetical protein GCM10007386_30060 [Pseudoduganella dura]
MNDERRGFLLNGTVLLGGTALPVHRAAASPVEFTPIDIQPLVDAALMAVEQARVSPGQYSRFLGKQQRSRAGGDKPSGYGSAAAACILYTASRLPGHTPERYAFVSFLRAGQSQRSGMFSDQYHNTTHATAYLLAALDLFDAGPVYPLHELQQLASPGGIEGLLAGLDWRKPWGASHYGAGAFAALFLAGQAPLPFQNRYFGWLAEHQDTVTGLWRKGSLKSADMPEGAPLFDALAAAFHYLFNHEAARRPIPRPAALIDSALRVRRENLYPTLGKSVGFAELDWLYCLTRSLRHSGHRREEVLVELAQFASTYVHHLLAHVQQNATPFEDLHALNGTISALAELQQALPGLLLTARPLRLALDRRPFI